MKGRRILATVDVYLVQVSEENAHDLRPAEAIVKEWCDQVFAESLYVMDEFSRDDQGALNKSWECKFDVDQTVIVRIVDSEEEFTAQTALDLEEIGDGDTVLVMDIDLTDGIELDGSEL